MKIGYTLLILILSVDFLERKWFNWLKFFLQVEKAGSGIPSTLVTSNPTGNGDDPERDDTSHHNEIKEELGFILDSQS